MSGWVGLCQGSESVEPPVQQSARDGTYHHVQAMQPGGMYQRPKSGNYSLRKPLLLSHATFQPSNKLLACSKSGRCSRVSPVKPAEMQPPPPSSEATAAGGLGAERRANLRTSLLLYGSIFGVVALFTFVFQVPEGGRKLQDDFFSLPGIRFNQLFRDSLLGFFSLAAGVLLLQYVVLRKGRVVLTPPIKKLGACVLFALVLGSGFSYFYTEKGMVRSRLVHTHDMFHYYMGPKYFVELGYEGLYDAVAYADSLRRRPALRSNARIRSLEVADGYGRISVAEAIERGRKRAAGFSPERWKEFQADVDHFIRMRHPGATERMLNDRGYNGTPFNAFLFGRIANVLPAPSHASLTIYTLFDKAFICLGLLALSVVFGWKVTALFAIAFFTGVGDRFSYTGGSFFRHLWLALLFAGVASLRARRMAQSGALIAGSAMLTAFPAVFLVGMGVRTGWHLVQRRLYRPGARFLVGAGVATAALGLLSIVFARGLWNYVDFLEVMSIHSHRLTFDRVGLGFLVILPTELANLDTSYRYVDKLAFLDSVAWLYRGIGLALIVFVGFMVRRRSNVEATVLMGVTIFFAMTTTVSYYYGFLGLLFLMWSPKTWRVIVGATFYLLVNGMIFIPRGIAFADGLPRWQVFRPLNNYALGGFILLMILGTLLVYLRDQGLCAKGLTRRIKGHPLHARTRSTFLFVTVVLSALTAAYALLCAVVYLVSS